MESAWDPVLRRPRVAGATHAAWPADDGRCPAVRRVRARLDGQAVLTAAWGGNSISTNVPSSFRLSMRKLP